MKLVFPGGEHPQVLLGPGVNRVGSDPQSTIQIDRPGMLPRLCELHVTRTGVMLQVPAGTTGIQVNGRAVDGMIALRPGDLVAFDQVQARLSSLDAVPPSAADAEPMRMPAPANDDAPAATAIRQVVPRFVLRGISGAAFGRTFPVAGPTIVGRAMGAGVRLDHPGISREHARLTPTDDGLLVEDLGSTNGCSVDEVRVERAVVRHGQEIGFDLVRFRLVESGAAPFAPPRESRPRAARGAVSPWWWAALAAAAAAAASVVYLAG